MTARRALVTGASGAFGTAVRAELRGRGWRVAGLDLSPSDDGEVIRCDVTDDDAVGELIDRAESALGPTDVFCANAGIATGGGLDAPDDVWDRALDVNVRAHVLAARRLVPRWLERGGGYFVSTASAAGLLTQIGDAPYSVSKHAAVAFAEWLSVTYGDRGVRVSCLCPMGVDTPMLQSGSGEQAADVVKAAGSVASPEAVAEEVVAALRDERFLILPHPEVLEFLRRKASDTDRWLAGMRRLQARVLRGS